MSSNHNAVHTDAGYRWVILGIVYLSLLSGAIVFQSIPPILSLLIPDLGLSHAEAGLLMSLFALVALFLSIPVGLLGDRYGAKNLIASCLALTVAGTLVVASANSFPILALGRLIAGAGAMSLFVVGSQLVSQWFAGRELGIASGIYTTALPVGTIVSLSTIGAAAGVIGWRASLLAGAALSAIALVAFLALYRPAPVPHNHHGQEAQHSPFSDLSHLGLPVWLLGATMTLFTAATISFVTFGPDYFVARGYGIQAAGFLAGFLMLLAPPISPLIGYILDRVGHEEAIIGIGGLLIAAGIFSISSSAFFPIVFLAVISLGNAIIPAPIYALPPRLLKPQLLGIGFGIVSTGTNLGIVLGPYVAGFARDATGSYQLSFYLMALFATLVAVLAGLLSMVRNRTRI
ncbi:MAG: MFS transporter [Actinobacteria bacterium]|nr:MFS transporter [Actinomycetota bacterium]